MAGGKGKKGGRSRKKLEGATATPAAARATTTTPAASSTAASPDDATEAAVAAEDVSLAATAEPAANGDPAPLAAESDALSAPLGALSLADDETTPREDPEEDRLSAPASAAASAAAAPAPAPHVAPPADATSPPPPARDPLATEPSKSVAFFDLDHTIIDTNSSWHWVQHEMHNGRVGASMLFTALYWFTRYALGFGAGAERAGAEAAELYAGTRAGDLEAEVEAFFQREMAHRQRPGCVSAMAAHASRRERCVICTTSWQHPARAAARLFGLESAKEDVISSVMEIDPETQVLTGKIAKVAYGDGKYHVTREWCERNGVDLADCTFYTDSMSDVMLMEHVGTPVAVNPDARLRAHAQKMGWDIQDWGIAEQKVKKPRYTYGCLNFSGASAGPG